MGVHGDQPRGRLRHVAIRWRRPGPGLIHHSDQGSQYTDSRYQAVLKDNKIQPSMNSVGSWYDNAPMESFFGVLKSEHVYHCVYRTRDEARPDVFYYIEGFYNPHRRHSTLGNISPAAFEKQALCGPSFLRRILTRHLV